MAERSMTRATPSLRLTASRPEIQRRAASLFFSASCCSSPLRSSSSSVVGLLAVAVVGLVVEDQDVLQAHQVGHDALDHLAFGFERVQLLRRGPGAGTRPPLESSSRSRSLKAW